MTEGANTDPVEAVEAIRRANPDEPQRVLCNGKNGLVRQAIRRTDVPKGDVGGARICWRRGLPCRSGLDDQQGRRENQERSTPRPGMRDSSVRPHPFVRSSMARTTDAGRGENPSRMRTPSPCGSAESTLA